MTTIIDLPHCRLLPVEVPELSRNFNIEDALYYQVPNMDTNDSRYGMMETDPPIILPPGQWSILGVWPDITEEQAGQVVEKNSGEYRNYAAPNGSYQWVFTALESLRSLLTANGVDVNKKQVLLIEKK